MAAFYDYFLTSCQNFVSVMGVPQAIDTSRQPCTNTSEYAKLAFSTGFFGRFSGERRLVDLPGN